MLSKFKQCFLAKNDADFNADTNKEAMRGVAKIGTRKGGRAVSSCQG